jgi:oligoendopeptidase F
MGLSCASAPAIDRASIPDQYKWKTELIFPSIEAWQRATQSTREEIDRLAEFQGTLSTKLGSEGAANLISYNRLKEKNTISLWKIMMYAEVNHWVAVDDSALSSRYQLAADLMSYAGEKFAWEKPELLKISRDTLLNWTETYPDLKPYWQPYSNMFALQAHTLSEPEERILSLALGITGSVDVNSPMRNAAETFANADMDFPAFVDENGDSVRPSYGSWRDVWRTSTNQQIREDCARAVFGKYNTYGNTLAALLATQYKTDVFLARVRHYNGTLQAALAPSFIPDTVYLNLIQGVRAGLKPMYRYEAIRKRALGLEHYTLWHDFVSLGSAGDEKGKTWEESAAIVVEALKPLGEQYERDLAKILDPKSGQVDVFTSHGKLAGSAFYAVADAPAYMRFNFNYEKGLLSENVSGIAHEAGHCLNCKYTESNQPLPLQDLNSLTIETPSSINEAFLAMKQIADARAVYQRATGTEREEARQRLIYLIDSHLIWCRDVYRLTMFAEWELRAHKLVEDGTPITKQSLSKLWSELTTEYYGPAMEQDELSNVFWAAYPHFYYGYYIYSYAVGEMASIALAQNICAEYQGNETKRGSTERYLNFLKAGSTKHPVELLQDAGVDMTTAAPIEEFVKYFSGLVDELDHLTRPAGH